MKSKHHLKVIGAVSKQFQRYFQGRGSFRALWEQFQSSFSGIFRAGAVSERFGSSLKIV